MDSTVVFAIILSAVGNIINAWGMIGMKVGHERADSKRMAWALQRYMEIRDVEDEDKGPSSQSKENLKDASRNINSAQLSTAFCKEGMWWLGFGTYSAGSLMHVASLAFGPSALLNPMEGLTLVANALSAPPCLGEILTWQDVVGTIVILIGTVVVVIFGPHSSETFTAGEMLDRFGRTPFVLWSIFIWSVTLAGWFYSKHIEYTNMRDDIQMDGSLKPRGAMFLALLYTNTKGVMGGYTMLFGKMSAEVLADSGEGDDQLTKWETYMFFLLFILFNVGMEYWRQKALSLFSTMYCVPLFQVSLVIFAVITGAIFFSEFDEMNTHELILFIVGVLIICLGVVILSSVTESRKQRSVKPLVKFKAAVTALVFIFSLKKVARGRVKGDKGNSDVRQNVEEGSHFNMLPYIAARTGAKGVPPQHNPLTSLFAPTFVSKPCEEHDLELAQVKPLYMATEQGRAWIKRLSEGSCPPSPPQQPQDGTYAEVHMSPHFLSVDEPHTPGGRQDRNELQADSLENEDDGDFTDHVANIDEMINHVIGC